jgi:hypothetical protein
MDFKAIPPTPEQEQRMAGINTALMMLNDALLSRSTSRVGNVYESSEIGWNPTGRDVVVLAQYIIEGKVPKI